MSRRYRTISVLDQDWERLKLHAISKRKPVSIFVGELLDFYEAHHGNGEKAPKDKGKREPINTEQEG